MPQFRVKVLVQCAPPNVTPDVANELVLMPRRVLFTPPPFLGEMLARAAQPIDVPDDATDETSDEAAGALVAARRVVPEGYGLDLVRNSFAHREVDGTYLSTGSGGHVFILGKAGGADIKPYTIRQRHELRAAGSDAPPSQVQVEFRCHLMVTAL
jgi:hypothetical protein